MKDKKDNISKQIAGLPKLPGVYQFYDTNGNIIYVGKAKNLKNRVSSYFNKNKYESFKTKILSRNVSSIKHVVVDTEEDALLLENNLIKRSKPKYNVLLKDDKTFPWIRIKNEHFPRVFKTRNIVRDGSVYFGPYTSGLMLKTMMKLIRELFKYRTCHFDLSPENIKRKKFKRCLEYHIGNCNAPCEGLEEEENYAKTINQIKGILAGNINEVIAHLKEKMKEHADELNFEEAAIVKEKINLLENYRSKSTIVSPKLSNIDVFSFLRKDKSAFVNYLKVVRGAIVQSYSIELVSRMNETDQELLGLAIIDIRSKLKSNAKELLVPFEPQDDMLNGKIIVPKIGDKKKLLDLSERNAKQYMIERTNLYEKKSYETKTNAILERIKKDLNLPSLPYRIECFDNSNLQGTNPVAACVVFNNAKPAKKEYRHYKIKTVEGPDDFASMKEVVFRRYKRLLNENNELPQLIVVDGGKGQLNAATEILKNLGIEKKVAIIGIAKRLEEIFFPGDPIPLYIDKNSPTLKIIQHIRNESHRFGIKFHRQLRSNNMLKTKLLDIEGIGPKRAEDLIKTFGSVDRIKESSLEELKVVIGSKLANIIYDFFHKE